MYIYCEDYECAETIFNEICEMLKVVYKLQINTAKSGIYVALDRRILGYEFFESNGSVGTRKFSYKPQESYRNWHASALQRLNNEFHIVQDGVLNKKDYALLFENEEEKHHIPVEVVDNMNLYGNVTISTNVLKTLCEKNIRLTIYNKYGDVEGYFVPQGYISASDTLLKQVSVYLDTGKRLEFAKRMEVAGLHNMRANLRYYAKKKTNKELDEAITEFGGYIDEIDAGSSVEELRLIEARARQKYYSLFNSIIEDENYCFVKRSKRPPRDAINAMISFGNTLLYNQIIQIIWKTSLDPRIGIVHASNRRSHTLNLDFADIFKPIVVDRVIFSLINLRQLKLDVDFECNENGSVYLSKGGKKLFISEFENKLASVMTVKGKKITYKRIMHDEVVHFQKAIVSGEKYKPYKYY